MVRTRMQFARRWANRVTSIVTGRFLTILAVGILACSSASWSGDPPEVPTAEQLQLLQQRVATRAALVEELKIESRVGVRTTQEILDGEERLYLATKALNVARVMAKTTVQSPQLEQEIAQAKLAALGELRRALEAQLQVTQQRVAVGELTKTDVHQVTAALLDTKYGESQIRSNLAKLRKVKR